MDTKTQDDAAGTSKANEGAPAATAAAPARNADPAATSQVQGTDEPVNYAAPGEAFTIWFNHQLRALSRPSIKLGAKSAEVIKLHPDGRLECEVEGAGSQNEKTFVFFDMTHFEQLIRKITARGL